MNLAHESQTAAGTILNAATVDPHHHRAQRGRRTRPRQVAARFDLLAVHGVDFGSDLTDNRVVSPEAGRLSFCGPEDLGALTHRLQRLCHHRGQGGRRPAKQL